MRDYVKLLPAELKTLPNQLTAARIVLLPFLWALALLKLPVLLGIGTTISFVTDILDGYLARKLGQVSAFGSKLDSLGDNLLILSGLVWLWLLRPEVYRDNALFWLIGITLYVTALLVGLLKFKRFANLHLQSSRIGSVALCLFVAHTFIAPQYSPLLFYVAMGMFVLSEAECLLIQLVCTEVDEHMGSILFVLRRQQSQ